MKKNKLVIHTPDGAKTELVSENTKEGRAEFKWFLQFYLNKYLGDVKPKKPESLES